MVLDIVDEIRKDRENGAKRLESEYKVGLMAFAKRFCADEVEAEALVYRTFSEVIAGIDGYTERSAFFGWMCKILINCHANDIRRRSNKDIEYVGSVPDMPDEGAARMVEAIDANILREAVEKLPPDMKEAVLLRYFMDMPILKVAQILAQPVGTVKSRLYYARVLLGMRLGAKLKKPGVALIAAALLLLGATAAVVGMMSAGQTIENGETASDETVSVPCSSNDLTVTDHLAAHEQSVTQMRSQSKAQPLHIVTSPSVNLSTLSVRNDFGSTGASQNPMSAPVSERAGDMRRGAVLAMLNTCTRGVRTEGVEAFDTVIKVRRSGPNMNLNCTKRSFTIVFR